MTDTTPPADAPETSPGFDLDDFEVRVLAVLIEKAFVTPDAYPMSINAILTGSNQLTAREPVMSLSEAEVQTAIDSLIRRRLVSKRDQPSARVAKYEHLVRLRHSLPPPEQAVLATLMLRGAQTAGELRLRCERLHRFDDIAAVDAVLEHLAEKYPALTRTLARAPGTKETRHVHLLGGEVAVEEMAESQHAGSGGSSSGRSRIAELEDEVRSLREDVEALRSAFDLFRQQFD